MNDVDMEYSRNLGFLSASEQEKLKSSVIAIAGAGGDGGMLALQLARLGVGTLKLADPDPFEYENINRQACATQKTVGVNKAQAVADYIHDINPRIKVEVFREGITEQNVAEFVAGADLVIDETEFTLHHIGVLLAREARKQNIPNVMAMNIGFGATVTSFVPSGVTFEEVLGLDISASIEDIRSSHVPLSNWLPFLPTYIDIKMLERVSQSEISAPSVAPGVALAAGTAAVETLLHLFNGSNNRREPTIAPSVLVIDAYEKVLKTVTYLSSSHETHLQKVIATNAEGKVPQIG